MEGLVRHQCHVIIGKLSKKNKKNSMLIRDFRVSKYLESNFGRHIGVQLSDNLKDSEELTRLKIKCKSAG